MSSFEEEKVVEERVVEEEENVSTPYSEDDVAVSEVAVEEPHVTHTFTVPVRKIFDEIDLEEFKKSTARQEITAFVKLCSKSIHGRRASDESLQVVSKTVRLLVEFMDRLWNLVDEIPPLHQPMRFGNKAFRTWHQRLVTESEAFITNLLTTANAELVGAVVELCPYLNASFGDPTRIDYGTGHELNMAVFLTCLYKLQIITIQDLPAVVLKVFFAYIRVMRKLQEIYKLEPAGTHGVWGLDDYHCLTFLWGSSQLIDHPYIYPGTIHDDAILREEAIDYLYLEGIYFIKRIKSSAPFGETSPMLNDISSLADWRKVMNGLVRLFEGEVLFKLPVVQHLQFGSLIASSWVVNSHGHSHSQSANIATPTAGSSAGGSQSHSHINQVGSLPFETVTRAPWAKF